MCKICTMIRSVRTWHVRQNSKNFDSIQRAGLQRADLEIALEEAWAPPGGQTDVGRYRKLLNLPAVLRSPRWPEI